MISGLDSALSRIASIRSAIDLTSSGTALDVGFDAVLARQTGDSDPTGASLVPQGSATGTDSPAAAWAHASVVLAALVDNTGPTASASTFTSAASAASPVPTGGRGTPSQWADAFRVASEQYGLPPGLLEAVAQVESGFNPSAVSSAGAQGLMQFMPATAAGLGVDPFDPESAIDGAARYLSSHLERFGSIEKALAAYNAGPGAVQRHGGVPPFAETQRYVAKVLAAWGTPS